MSVISMGLAAAALVSCGADPAATSKYLEDAEFGAQWMQAIEEAREEGQVVIVPSAHSSRDHRPVFRAFTEKYGIKIITAAGASAGNVQRLLAERSRGRFTADVVLMGPSSSERLRRASALVPLEPEFVHPEVADRSRNWLHKYQVWIGAEPGYVAAFLLSAKENISDIYYNSERVSEEEIGELHSWDDFLQPRWKGRAVAILDPSSQFGTSHWQEAWTVLGRQWFEEFMRTAQPTLLPESSGRQLADGLARGKYDIALFTVSGARRDLDRMEAVGIPVKKLSRTLVEGISASIGGGVAILDRAPHPKAARLFVNWYLSREGQDTRHALIDMEDPRPSLRTDVQQGRVPDYAWQIARGLSDASGIRDNPELAYAALDESSTFVKTMCMELGCYGY